jgi:lipopolysaccharide/colanic/teichoic acid biosynthesis glycosyltransferase
MTDTCEDAGRHTTSPAPAGALSERRRDDAIVTLQSGLPLTLRAGMPLPPADPARLARVLRRKRVVLDVPLALLAMLALSPLLVAVSLIIGLTSPGPVVFRQKRVGLGGIDFDILKFRSMRVEASDASGVRQTMRNDDRVTAIGRFLRATSIDELPQLVNILRGDMSVIGPRPMVRGQLAGGADYRVVVPYYDFRHLVRPGLSGWAQANGLRGPTTQTKAARQRVDHDCAYVQNVSLALDLQIIVRTIRREFLIGSGL